ncbi:MAG TPA: HAMP domain-containing sensor histidine kinase [Chthoniobacterales bacterium]
MLRSLRGVFVLLWVFVALVCGALAFQLHGLFELGVGGEITQVQRSVERSAQGLLQAFDAYISSFSEAPADFETEDRRRELLLLLDLILGRYAGVEGGFWSSQNRFIAYSFPTHEPLKRDVPEAESGRISALNRRVLSTRKEETARFNAAGEVLLLHVVPVRPDLVIWTMSRAHVRAAAAFEQLTVGFVALLVLLLATGGLILWYLQRWGGQLLRLEAELGSFQLESRLSRTGLEELDRLLTAFNRQTERLREAQARSHGLSAQLQRAERLAALGRMSAGLAHEIRNPLGTIRLQVENVLAKAANDAHERAFHRILREISRLDDLIERLLAIVRLDQLNVRPTPLRPWLEECVHRIRQNPTSMRFEIHAPEADWPMDERQMARALDNLLANAVRHTPPDGWVCLCAERQDNGCFLAVEDSGPGIPAELREQVFEPFVSFRSNGTGLGLAIAREIVEAHGGTIVCTAGERGARFEVRWPWREC